MRKRGFTLLEVMISLAILAVSLVALSGLNGGAVNMEAYARRATEATLLLRSKMNDVEEELHKDGFSDFDDEKHGSFEEEGGPDYAWRAEILKPDVQLDASQLLGIMGLSPNKPAGSSSGSSSMGPGPSSSTLTQGLAGAAAGMGMKAQGGAAAALAGGPLAGILQGQATGFIETLKKSVREVRITVSWRDGKEERTISASQILVILPESVGKAGQVQTAAPQQGPLPAAPPGRAPTPGLPPTGVTRPSGDGDSR
jgi:general secretion pathway protein I